MANTNRTIPVTVAARCDLRKSAKALNAVTSLRFPPKIGSLSSPRGSVSQAMKPLLISANAKAAAPATPIANATNADRIARDTVQLLRYYLREHKREELNEGDND